MDRENNSQMSETGSPSQKGSRIRNFQDDYNVLRRINREQLMEGHGSYNLPYLLICFVLIGVFFIMVVVMLIKIFS